MAMDMTVVPDADAVKLAAYFVLERLILGRVLRNPCSTEYLSLVDDLAVFNDFPWGRVAYDATYASLSSAIKLREVRLGRSKKSGVEAEPTYNINGFSFAFQVS